MKQRDINKLSEYETTLLNRFITVNTSIIADMAFYINYEKHHFFVEDILSIVAEDVFKLLSIERLDEATTKTIISFAKELYESKQYECYGYPTNVVFALTMIWISYFTEYKDYGSVYKLTSDIDGLCKSEYNAFYSMCEAYFNLFGGPMNIKRRRFANYMFKTLGKDYFCKQNDDHTLNFLTLITLLDLNGLKYRPCELHF